MWNKPTAKELEAIPKLYETEETPLKDKIIHLHFFIGSCDWYIAEYSISALTERPTLWGFACLGNKQNAEWGYIDLEELDKVISHVGIVNSVTGVLPVEVDRDLYWTPKKASEVPLIAECQGWK